MWQVHHKRELSATWSACVATDVNFEPDTDRWPELTVKVDPAGSGISLLVNQRSIGRLQPVGDQRFSPPCEDYIRGNQWHCVFPQDTNAFSMKVVWTMVEHSSSHLLIEPTISIQTSLLDSQPVLDWVVPGVAVSVDLLNDSSRPCPLVQSRSSEDQRSEQSLGIVTVLSRSDASSTSDASAHVEMRLRLFGEFLEKGVIRKSRPWILIQTPLAALSREQATHWQQRLESTPLPLTA
ncbi:MAG: hypothetical protein AAF539_02010 [Planctomycetota bacterium]